MIFFGVRPALATRCSLSSAQGTHSHTQALFFFSPSLSSLLPFCKPDCNDTTRNEELGPALLFLSPVLRSPVGDALLGRWAPLSYPASLCLALSTTAREARMAFRFDSGWDWDELRGYLLACLRACCASRLANTNKFQLYSTCSRYPCRDRLRCYPPVTRRAKAAKGEPTQS
jgi:hypothetical protein